MLRVKDSALVKIYFPGKSLKTSSRQHQIFGKGVVNVSGIMADPFFVIILCLMQYCIRERFLDMNQKPHDREQATFSVHLFVQKGCARQRTNPGNHWLPK